MDVNEEEEEHSTEVLYSLRLMMVYTVHIFTTLCVSCLHSSTNSEIKELKLYTYNCLRVVDGLGSEYIIAYIAWYSYRKGTPEDILLFYHISL